MNAVYYGFIGSEDLGKQQTKKERIEEVLLIDINNSLGWAVAYKQSLS